VTYAKKYINHQNDLYKADISAKFGKDRLSGAMQHFT
jgi:hypothetical protein